MNTITTILLPPAFDTSVKEREHKTTFGSEPKQHPPTKGPKVDHSAALPAPPFDRRTKLPPSGLFSLEQCRGTV